MLYETIAEKLFFIFASVISLTEGKKRFRDVSRTQDLPKHYNRRYPFIHLGGERHFESKVSCPRTTTSRARTWTARSGDEGASVLTRGHRPSTSAAGHLLGSYVTHVLISLEAVMLRALSVAESKVPAAQRAGAFPKLLGNVLELLVFRGIFFLSSNSLHSELFLVFYQF